MCNRRCVSVSFLVLRHFCVCIQFLGFISLFWLLDWHITFCARFCHYLTFGLDGSGQSSFLLSVAYFSCFPVVHCHFSICFAVPVGFTHISIYIFIVTIFTSILASFSVFRLYRRVSLSTISKVPCCALPLSSSSYSTVSGSRMGHQTQGMSAIPSSFMRTFMFYCLCLYVQNTIMFL